MKKRAICFLLLILLLLAGSAWAESAAGTITCREDLNGRPMGIVTGTSFEAPTLEYFPDSQHLYFSTNSDLVTALTSYKIDGFLCDEPVVRIMCKEVPEMTYLSEMITQDDYAFGFGKKGERADKIRGQFNEMLAQCMADGTMEALYDKWFGDDEAAKVVDMTGFSGENGKLNVVTSCASVPFSYIKDGQKVGIAMEMVEMFCRRYGYTPYIEDVDVAARIPGLVTGKYDMCAAPMTITEERKESINFSDPYYKGGIVLAVRKADVAASAAESVPAPAPAQDAGAALAALDVKRMGIVTGTSFEAPTLQYFPSSEHLYYNSYTDVAAALVNNKIDGFLGDEPALRMLVKEVPGITCLPEKLVNDDYAFGFGKSGERADKLRAQFDEMLAEIKADGTLEALGEKWFGDDENVKTVDLKNGFSGENGKLNVVTTATDVPFSYVKDNQYVGLSIELVEMFCRRYGYTPVIADVDFSARMPGLVSGKYDMCASSMAITEERKESISFSAPFYQGGIVLAMRKEDVPVQAEEPKAANDFSQLAGKRIGVQTGTICGPVTEAAIPTAKLSYFNTATDVLTALMAGKVDAWCHDEPVIRFMAIDNPGLTILDGFLAESNLAAIFPKTEAGQKLRDQYSAFVDQLWADGTMKVIDSIWFGADESRRTVLDYENLPATNGTLRMAADTTQIPFAYVKDNRAVGYDIDIAARFCQAYGYRLEVVQMNFDGVLASVQQGKCDFAACCITITEERAESVLFSSPDYYGGLVMAVMGDTSAAPKQTASASDTISSLNDLANARIGVQVGTPYDALINKLLPNATISYYNTYPDMVAALEANKIDAFPGDEPVMIFMAAEDSRLAVLPEHLEECEMAYVLPKTEAGEKLGSELNAWIASMNASGEMDQLIKKWTEGPESEKTVPDYASFPAPNGVLKLATEGAYTPMNYFRGSELVGLEIDMTARFCEDCGYGLTVEAMNFDGILPAIKAGKADFAAASILITEERKESVNFSDPYYIGGTVMIVPSSKASSQEATQGLTALSDLAKARIGVQTGTTFDEIVLEAFPEAKISYFNSYPDMAAAMEANKIDAFPGDEPVIQLMAAENPKLAVLQERMDSFDFGIALPKTEAGEKLLGEINAWLASAKANGELQKITDKWTTGPESGKTLPDYASFPAPNGVLTLATEGAYAPMNYFRGNEVVGMEIDMLARFCEANGYGLKVVPMQFDAILPAIQSGKADFAAAGLTITEERKESVYFSDPYYTGGTVMAVLKSKLTATAAPQGTIVSLNDLANARIGVQTGTTFDEIVLDTFPEAKISYFNSYPDMAAAMEANKIDAFPGDEPVIQLMAAENPKLAVLQERMDSFDFGIALPKTEAGEKLLGEINAWLASAKANGELQKITDKWTTGPESGKTLPDYASFPAPNGVLTLATEGAYAPMNYFRGNEVVGMEIDMLARFCEANGYGLKVVPMQFDAILPAIQSGKADFAAAGLTITEERKESVNFSDPYYTGGTVMAVLKSSLQPETAPQPAAPAANSGTAPSAPAPAPAAPAVQKDTFWDGIVASFNKTFIREDRWKLFTDGVLTTLLITVLSILCGTALGFAVFMLCRKGNIIANSVTKFSMWLVQGMPMVVLLMILYYIIFGSVAISGLVVAVIGFTLTFGASVFGLLKMGVGAVDGGQYEAAYALGYSSRRTFFKIILPQALPHVMPAYKGEIVGLIKATAIVGYIAVQDLTKMGDIVRSRTYEAFFPLIAVTVIYFVLEGLLGFLISRIQVRLDPKRRRRDSILKGVNLHD